MALNFFFFSFFLIPQTTSEGKFNHLSSLAGGGRDVEAGRGSVGKC